MARQSPTKKVVGRKPFPASNSEPKGTEPPVAEKLAEPARGSYPWGIPRFSQDQLDGIEELPKMKKELSHAKEEIRLLRNALTQRGADPDIIKRRAIVQQNSPLQAQGLCELFDSMKIPLTRSMKEAGSWTGAYRSPICRPRIDSLICRDRKS